MAIMCRIPITLDKATPDMNVAFLLIKKIHIWVSIDMLYHLKILKTNF